MVCDLCGKIEQSFDSIDLVQADHDRLVGHLALPSYPALFLEWKSGPNIDFDQFSMSATVK
jgi:hypothetical protein